MSRANRLSAVLLAVGLTAADLQGATPVISVSGWNLPKIDIAAPAP